MSLNNTTCDSALISYMNISVVGVSGDDHYHEITSPAFVGSACIIVTVTISNSKLWLKLHYRPYKCTCDVASVWHLFGDNPNDKMNATINMVTIQPKA